MRRSNSEVVPVRSYKVEGVMDPAPTDVGGSEALGRIIPASSLDIVHHQVERRGGAGFRRLFRLSYDDMSAAAELKDSEVGVGKNRT